MPSGRTLVWDVGGGGSMMVHGKKGDVPRVYEMAGPLPSLWSRNYCRINYGAHTVYAWDGAIN